MTKPAALIILLGLIGACSNGAAVPQTYAFLPLTTELAADRAQVVVRLPDYLRQAGLVVQTGDNRVTAANHHLWAEPLEQGIARIVEASLDGSARKPIHIDVVQFHGTADGMVRLQAYWRSGDREGRFSELKRQQQDGMDAMIDTQAELLRAFARTIASELGASND